MELLIIFGIVILLLSGTSALGIFFARKNKSIKNFTSKTPTILFLTVLTVFAFFFSYVETERVAYSIGHTFGFVYLLSLPSAALGILFMNKFKFQKKEFWMSWFFSLIWVFVILISQNILKI
jgi:hypothetical protein